MFFSQKPTAFSAPVSSGFFAVPSVACASAFEGVEGTAQNGIHGLSVSDFAFLASPAFSPWAAKKADFDVAVSVPLQLTNLTVCRLSSTCRLGS